MALRSVLLSVSPLLFLFGTQAASLRFDQDKPPVYLGYSDDDGGCIFLGRYERGQFLVSPDLKPKVGESYALAANEILKSYQPKTNLSSIDREGRPQVVQVKETNANPQLGELSISVSVQQGEPGEGSLFSTVPLPIRILRQKNASLPADVAVQLSRRCKLIFRRHVAERALDERPSGFKLERPVVLRIEGVRDLLVVTYRSNIFGTDQHGARTVDDRGSFFFIYSMRDRRIIDGKFGHVEWAPHSTVWTEMPEFFFRIGNNPEVFFVGTCIGGWEDWGHAIYELRTGRRVLLCY